MSSVHRTATVVGVVVGVGVIDVIVVAAVVVVVVVAADGKDDDASSRSTLFVSGAS